MVKKVVVKKIAEEERFDLTAEDLEKIAKLVGDERNKLSIDELEIVSKRMFELQREKDQEKDLFNSYKRYVKDIKDINLIKLDDFDDNDIKWCDDDFVGLLLKKDTVVREAVSKLFKDMKEMEAVFEDRMKSINKGLKKLSFEEYVEMHKGYTGNIGACDFE